MIRDARVMSSVTSNEQLCSIWLDALSPDYSILCETLTVHVCFTEQECRSWHVLDLVKFVLF